MYTCLYTHAYIYTQVKINGIRLELGEVENVLMRCQPVVTHVAALLIEGKLVCAVTCASEGCVHDLLRREAVCGLLMLVARRELAAAICPSRILLLDHMPLTPTGKLDRIALRPILIGQLSEDATPIGGGGRTHAALAGQLEPLGPLEQAVADEWRVVLGVRVHPYI